MNKDDLDEFLRALAAYYMPDVERVLIETQEQADEVNATNPPSGPYRVGDCYLRRTDKPIRLH